MPKRGSEAGGWTALEGFILYVLSIGSLARDVAYEVANVLGYRRIFCGRFISGLHGVVVATAVFGLLSGLLVLLGRLY